MRVDWVVGLGGTTNDDNNDNNDNNNTRKSENINNKTHFVQSRKTRAWQVSSM